MVYNPLNNFAPPRGSGAPGRYCWRIVLGFGIAFAVVFSVAYSRLKPGYRAQAEYRLLPVAVSEQLGGNPENKPPLSVQATLLCERLLENESLLKSKAVSIQPAGLGGIIRISCQAEDKLKAEELLSSVFQALQTAHAAGQAERRAALARKLRAAIAEAERKQALLDLEITTYLEALKIPEAARAEILKAGLDSELLAQQLEAYRADFSARKGKLQAAREKEKAALQKLDALLADPRKQEIHTTETVRVETPEGRELRARLVRLQKELRAYLQTSTELHPFVRNTRRKIAQVRKKLAAAGSAEKTIEKVSPNPEVAVWKKAKTAHLNTLAALDRQIEDLDKEYSRWEGYAAAAPRRLALAEKKRQLTATRKRLAATLTLLDASEPPVWSRLENYREPRVTALDSRPDYQKIIIYGALAGLTLSFLLVGLGARGDSAIKDADDAARYFSTPVLAAIPRAGSKGGFIPPSGSPPPANGAGKLVLIAAVVLTLGALMVSQYCDLNSLGQQVRNRLGQRFSGSGLDAAPDAAAGGDKPVKYYLFEAMAQPQEEEFK